MDQETEVAQAPTPQAPELSLRERMTKSVTEASPVWSGATTDSATVAAPSAEVPAVQVPAGVEQAPVEIAPATVAAPVDDTPYTTDQLRDKSFWGGLDKEGWAKAERLHPVETALVKAAQGAASRIVNAARKEVPAPPDTAQPATQTAEPELTAEHQALLDAIELGTPAERFKAFQQLATMTVESVPEVQATRENEKRAKLMQQARDIAVLGDEVEGIPPFPELENYDEAVLNAAYDKDPTAKAMAKIGTPAAIALAMQRVGEIVKAQKLGETARFEAEQDKLRRNANTPASNAVLPSTAGPIPTKPQTMNEFVQSEWGKVAVRANQ